MQRAKKRGGPLRVVRRLVRPYQVFLEQSDVRCKWKCEPGGQGVDDAHPLMIEMRLPPRRCGFAVLARNPVAVGKMRGDAVPAEQVVDAWIKRFELGDETVLNVGRRRVQRVVQVDANALAIIDRKQRVRGVGLDDPAMDPGSQLMAGIIVKLR